MARFRRLAVRYERRDDIHLAFATTCSGFSVFAITSPSFPADPLSRPGPKRAGQVFCSFPTVRIIQQPP